MRQPYHSCTRNLIQAFPDYRNARSGDVYRCDCGTVWEAVSDGFQQTVDEHGRMCATVDMIPGLAA